MPDRLMFYEDSYVILSPRLEQKFVNLEQLRQILGEVLASADVVLSADFNGLDRDAQIDRLIAMACELETIDGKWQWFVVRLEK